MIYDVNSVINLMECIIFMLVVDVVSHCSCSSHTFLSVKKTYGFAWRRVPVAALGQNSRNNVERATHSRVRTAHVHFLAPRTRDKIPLGILSRALISVESLVLLETISRTMIP